jgi:hypothetical protein
VADPPRSPETAAGAGPGPDRGTPGGSRRWVIVLGIVIAVALLGLLVFLHVTGTIGPGLHQ